MRQSSASTAPPKPSSILPTPKLVAYFRVMLIMGVLFIAMVFLGAYALVSAAEEEKPLAGSVSNTLGADKTKEKAPDKDHR